jgi:hypothetical protein
MKTSDPQFIALFQQTTIPSSLKEEDPAILARAFTTTHEPLKGTFHGTFMDIGGHRIPVHKLPSYVEVYTKREFGMKKVDTIEYSTDPPLHMMRRPPIPVITRETLGVFRQSVDLVRGLSNEVVIEDQVLMSGEGGRMDLIPIPGVPGGYTFPPS